MCVRACHLSVASLVRSLFLAALAVFLVVLSKASSALEEKARDHDDHANDAAASK